MVLNAVQVMVAWAGVAGSSMASAVVAAATRVDVLRSVGIAYRREKVLIRTSPPNTRNTVCRPLAPVSGTETVV